MPVDLEVVKSRADRSEAAELLLPPAEQLPRLGEPVLQPSWPVLPSEARYGLAGEIVSVIEPHSEADPAGLLISTLVEFGALVGPGPHAMADSAEHPARLYSVLVGKTSKGRKGSAAKNVERVIAAVDPDFARNRRLDGFGSGEALVDTVRGDSGATDPRLLVVEPEFARILNVASRDGSTLSLIVRQGWDGGRLAVRSRSATTIADNSHVCVIGHISADELRAKLTQTEVASGFANRFLFVCVRRSKSLPSGGNLDDGEVAGLGRRLADTLTKVRNTGILRRTPAAEALWADLYEQMARDEPGGLLEAIIARDSAQMLRLSVTYALMDGARSIDVEHVSAAWALWCYCRASAAYVFGESLGDQIADRLLRAVREAGPDGLDGTQQRDLFAKHASGAQLDSARSLLERRGLVCSETVQTRGRPALVLRAVESLSSLRSQTAASTGTPFVAKSLLSQSSDPPSTLPLLSSHCDISDKSRIQEKGQRQSEIARCDISDESDISFDLSPCDESDISTSDNFDRFDEVLADAEPPEQDDWGDAPPLTDEDLEWLAEREGVR